MHDKCKCVRACVCMQRVDREWTKQTCTPCSMALSECAPRIKSMFILLIIPFGVAYRVFPRRFVRIKCHKI